MWNETEVGMSKVRKVIGVLLLLFLLLPLMGCSRKNTPSIPEVVTPVEENEDDHGEVDEVPDSVIAPENEHQEDTSEEEENPEQVKWYIDKSHDEMVSFLEERYGDRNVKVFGENISGVYTHMDVEEKVLALTLDACGGMKGSAYDHDLMEYLIEEKIPATLFINGRWISANPELFRTLCENELFEIENHGHEHRPLSVEGKDIYGIRGTGNIREAMDEVMMNQDEIQKLTGRRPRYFRSGTAYYDDVALDILKDLDLKALNFDILGDAGATFNRYQMLDSAKGVKPGSILLYHMNQPQKEVAEGIKLVVPMLREMGYEFVRLSDYDEYLK